MPLGAILQVDERCKVGQPRRTERLHVEHGECLCSTNHPSDVAEAALAHMVKDKTEAAYRRGNLLEKRRLLMADWAAYCCRGRLDGSALVGRS